jgi:uncharacterized protein (DUF302 family)
MTGSPRWGTIRAVLVTSSCVGHAETVSRLVAAVEAAGMTVFARIDHAAGAREVGLELADEQVVLFGNPKAGTLLMQGDPKIGVELPLRMLVWAVGDDVLVGYDDPRELAGRYAVDEHHGTLEAMAKLLAELAIQAASTGA